MVRTSTTPIVVKILAFRKKYADDLLRPVFDWSAQQVIDYILKWNTA